MAGDKVMLDPKTGSPVWWDGTDWVNVSHDFDPRGGFGQDLGNAASQVIGGAERMLGDPGGEARQRGATQDLDASGSQGPGALGAQMLMAVPEIAAGGAGSALVRGGAAALGAALGATQSPDNPALGAALGGAAGGAGTVVRAFGKAAVANRLGAPSGQTIQRITDAIRPGGRASLKRQAIRASREADARSVDIRGRPGGAGAQLSPRNQDPGLPLADDVVARGRAMTEGQENYLRAINTGEDIEGASLRWLDEGAARGTNDEGVRLLQKQGFTRDILSQLDGDSSQVLLSPRARIEARKRASQVFQEAADRAPNISRTGLIDDIRTSFNRAPAEAKKIADDVVANLERQTSEGLEASSYQQLRNELRRDMESAMKRGEHESGAAIGDIIDMMDERVLDGAGTELGAQLRVARRQWRILKALESPSVLSADGTVNAKTFANRWKARGPQKKGGTASDPAGAEFDKQVRLAEFLAHEPSRSSGTAERLLRAGAKTGGTALGLGALGNAL